MRFVQRDYPQLSWNIKTLDRGLKAFNITYADKCVSIEDVCKALIIAQCNSKSGKYTSLMSEDS